MMKELGLCKPKELFEVGNMIHTHSGELRDPLTLALGCGHNGIYHPSLKSGDFKYVT